MKKRINSRTKGNTFENRVSRLVLTAFECFGITKKDCYRTPSSGGHKYAREEDPGDLVISRKLRRYFPFHVEAKHYNKVALWPLYFPVLKQRRAWKFRVWLRQLRLASTQTKLRPLLVFKGNGNMPIMCAFPAWTLKKGKRKELKWPDELVAPFYRTQFKYNDRIWYVTKFDSFLRVVVKGINNNGKTS